MIAEALVCLALNAYHEARNQDVRGMIAVSQVVMNRVESEHFPDNVCDVVFQGPHRQSWANADKKIPLRDRCQFSWYCDGKLDEPLEKQAWETSVLVARGILNDSIHNLVGDSLWYHADYVEPDWAAEKQEYVTLGNHIFYEIRSKN